MRETKTDRRGDDFVQDIRRHRLCRHFVTSPGTSRSKGPRIPRSMEPFVACRPHRETAGSEVQVLMSPLSPVLWTSLDCESLINLYQIHEDTVPVLRTNVGTCWNQVRRFRFSACVISLLLSSCIITGRALVRCTFANLGFNCFTKCFKDKNDNVTT